MRRKKNDEGKQKLKVKQQMEKYRQEREER